MMVQPAFLYASAVIGGSLVEFRRVVRVPEGGVGVLFSLEVVPEDVGEFQIAYALAGVWVKEFVGAEV
jgi:hypothetical protein